MTVFRGVRKAELEALARELSIEGCGDMTRAQLIAAIENTEDFEEDSMRALLEAVCPEVGEKARIDREREAERAHELELKKLEVELERVRIQARESEVTNHRSSLSSRSSEGGEGNFRVKPLEEIIRTVRLLTVKVPTKPEGWNFFFTSLEKAFECERVEDEQKARVLVSLLGEKAAGLLTNLEANEYGDYQALKRIVLAEFEPSAEECLENFKRAKRRQDENFAQYATRLSAMWDYYVKLRGALEVDTVNQLIVADKMLDTLDRETKSHILVRQGDSWFRPKMLAQECDRFLAAKGRSYAYAPKVEETGRENKYSSGEMAETREGNPKEKRSGCFVCGSKDHFKRECPKRNSVGRGAGSGPKSVRVNLARETETQNEEFCESSEASRELEVDTERMVIARVGAIRGEDLPPVRGKLDRVRVKVNGRTVKALLDSGSDISVVRQDIIGKVETSEVSSVLLKGIFGPPVKCPLVRLKLAREPKNNEICIPTEIICAVVREMDEELLIPPKVFDMIGVAQSQKPGEASTGSGPASMPKKVRDGTARDEAQFPGRNRKNSDIARGDSRLENASGKGVASGQEVSKAQQYGEVSLRGGKRFYKGKREYFEQDQRLDRKGKGSRENTALPVLPKQGRRKRHSFKFKRNTGWGNKICNPDINPDKPVQK